MKCRYFPVLVILTFRGSTVVVGVDGCRGAEVRRFIIATLRFVVVSPSSVNRRPNTCAIGGGVLCPAPASESATRVFMSVPGTTGWLYLEDVVKHNKWVERFFVLDEGHPLSTTAI